MKDPDKMHQEYYNKDTLRGIEIGKKHSQPSPLTLKFMEQTRLFNQEIKQEVEYIKTQLTNIPTKQDMLLANKDLLKEVFDKIDSRLKEHGEDSDKKYAVKQVEKLVYAGIGMILSAFMGGLIYAGFYFANNV